MPGQPPRPDHKSKDDRQILGSLTSGGSRNNAVGSLDWPWSGSSRSSSSSSSGSIKVLHYSHGISMELEAKVMELFNGYGYICSKLRPIPWHNIFNKILKIESKISRQGEGNHPSNVETQEKSLTTLKQWLYYNHNWYLRITNSKYFESVCKDEDPP